METKYIIIIIITILVIFLTILYYVLSEVLFKVIFGNLNLDKIKKRYQKKMDKLNIENINNQKLNSFICNLKFNTIFIKSFDNLNLCGEELFNNEGNHDYVIFFHGYRGHPIEEFSSMINHFHELNFNVLAIHERAHNKSEGKYFTMGKNERKDLISWCNYIIEKDKEAKIVLFGRSMGGHTVLLASDEILFKNHIKCIISDCAYSSLKSQFIQYMDKIKIRFPALQYKLFNFYLKTYRHFSMKSETKKHLSNALYPICLIHGDKDEIVNFEELEKNASYIKNIYFEKHVFQNARHCKSEESNPELYKQIVDNFVFKFVN
ncbi:MAG: alpha/beta hydrolase [Bacillales bacterium]